MCREERKRNEKLRLTGCRRVKKCYVRWSRVGRERKKRSREKFICLVEAEGNKRRNSRDSHAAVAVSKVRREELKRRDIRTEI